MLGPFLGQASWMPEPPTTPPDVAVTESTPPQHWYGKLGPMGYWRHLHVMPHITASRGPSFHEPTPFVYTCAPGDSLLSLSVWSGRPWQSIYDQNRQTLENAGYCAHSRTGKTPATPLAPGMTLCF